jgi:DNA-directed RNA polymerase subunit RPC12/RpoP
MSFPPIDQELHGIATLTCPSCGSPDIHHLPNEDLPPLIVITPYHCTRCHRTFESGPFHLRQKAHIATDRR